MRFVTYIIISLFNRVFFKVSALSISLNTAYELGSSEIALLLLNDNRLEIHESVSRFVLF